MADMSSSSASSPASASSAGSRTISISRLRTSILEALLDVCAADTRVLRSKMSTQSDMLVRFAILRTVWQRSEMLSEIPLEIKLRRAVVVSSHRSPSLSFVTSSKSSNPRA